MNKQELIERMAGKTGMAKKDCGIALDGCCLQSQRLCKRMTK